MDLAHKKDIKAQLVELLSSDNFDSVAGKIDTIAKQFMLEYKDEEKKIERLQLDIDKDFEIDAEELKINNEIIALIDQFKAIRKEIKQQKTKQENENLKLKEALLNELKNLVENEEHIGKAIVAIQDIRNKWNEIGNIPRDKYQDVQTEYSRLNDQFSYNIQIFKELKEHDLKKNYSLKNQVIYELSQLANEKDLKKVEQSYRQLQNSWNEIGGTYQDKWEELKDKYWAEIKQINERIKAHYEGLKKEKEENYSKKLELIEKVKNLTSVFEESHNEYEKLTKTLLEIQEQWNKIGPIEKSKHEDIWKNFRSLYDTFFEKKANFYAKRKDEYSEHTKAKEAIIQQIEALKTSTDWDKTGKKIIQLQEDWKKLGNAGPKNEQRLWKRLRDASDYFFNARKKQMDSLKNEEKENLSLKNALIDEVKNYTSSSDKKQDIIALNTISEKFNAIGNVPFKVKDAIIKSFKTAIDEKFKSLGITKDEKDSILFDTKIQKADVSEIKNIIASERKRIYKQISFEEETLKKYENNLGFFNISKSGEGLFKNVESNMQASKEKIESLKNRLEFLKNKEKELAS